MSRVRAGVAAVVLAFGITSCGGASAPTTTPAASTPPATTPAATTPPATTPPASTSPSAPVFGYMPLWPFGSVAEAVSWQQSPTTDAWHTDAGGTALRFTRDYLRITDVDRVTSRAVGARDAHIGVGFRTEGSRTGTAAVVHLVRIGAGATAPWEVVGTDDRTLSLTKPAYGATVASPTVVGGRITGVDESLRVTVRTLGATDPVGSACCQPAGGENQPWSMRVSFRATAGQTLTIVVTTGGHLLGVEQFAVTGVRAR